MRDVCRFCDIIVCAYISPLLLRLDSYGNLECIAISNQQRRWFVNAPSEMVYKAYKALFELADELHAQENEFHWKLREGDILVFNNKRVLHGRKAYDPSLTSRSLEGAYLDWDEILSVYRVLRKQKTRKNELTQKYGF